MSCGVGEHVAINLNFYFDYNSIVSGSFNPEIKKDMGAFSLLDNYFIDSGFPEFISKYFAFIILRRLTEVKFSSRDYCVLSNNFSSLHIYCKC